MTRISMSAAALAIGLMAAPQLFAQSRTQLLVCRDGQVTSTRFGDEACARHHGIDRDATRRARRNAGYGSNGVYAPAQRGVYAPAQRGVYTGKYPNGTNGTVYGGRYPNTTNAPVYTGKYPNGANGTVYGPAYPNQNGTYGRDHDDDDRDHDRDHDGPGRNGRGHAYGHDKQKHDDRHHGRDGDR